MNIHDFFQREIDTADAKAAASRRITVEELRQERAAEQELRSAAASEHFQRESAEKHRQQVEYGQRLGLGVAARPAIALVLSGLLERSDGTGRFKRTVAHVELMDDFKFGRLERKRGQFLCRKHTSRCDTGDLSFDSEITCPKCQEILDRISR